MSTVLRLLRGQFGLLMTLNPLAKTAMTDVSTELITAMQDSISEPDESSRPSQISPLSFQHLSQVALHILLLTFITLHLVREAYVLH